MNIPYFPSSSSASSSCDVHVVRFQRVIGVALVLAFVVTLTGCDRNKPVTDTSSSTSSTPNFPMPASNPTAPMTSMTGASGASDAMGSMPPASGASGSTY